MNRRNVKRDAKAIRAILAIDIGGTSVKFLASGRTKARSVRSGGRMTPAQMVEAVRKRTRDWPYDAVSIGYPGLVGASGPVTEPANLGGGWVGFDFAAAFEHPLRIVNDATMQALGSYDGGRMLFLGFGTGIGSVLIVDQAVVPLELGELRWKGRKFSEQFGDAALRKVGRERWREAVLEAVPSLQRAFIADYTVLGGGNAKRVIEPLPPNVRIGHNLTAFRGGYRLWGIDQGHTSKEGDRNVRRARPLGDWLIL